MHSISKIALSLTIVFRSARSAPLNLYTLIRVEDLSVQVGWVVLVIRVTKGKR